MGRRQYKGNVATTVLAAPITNASTTFTVATGGGTSHPDGSVGPFVETLDYGTPSGEEKVLCSSRSGDVFTILTRGYDGSAAASHAAGAKVLHTISAVDLDEANQHVTGSTGVHGLTGAVVGTTDAQTLSNKTLTTPTIGSFVNAQHDHSSSTAGGATVGGALQGCRVSIASLTVPNSTETAVPWSAETFDTAAFHDLVTNPSRLTVPSGKGGYYEIRCAVSFSLNASGQRYLAMKKNGSTVAEYDGFGSAAGSTSLVMSDVINLAVGDYVEFFVYQSSGADLALNLSATENYASLIFKGV